MAEQVCKTHHHDDDAWDRNPCACPCCGDHPPVKEGAVATVKAVNRRLMWVGVVVVAGVLLLLGWTLVGALTH